MTPDEYQEMMRRPLTPFQERLAQLDMVLTEKPWRACEHAAKQQRFEAVNFTCMSPSGDRSYYLADGGYSRICCGDRGRLFLTSNSLEKPRLNWHKPECRTLIVALEADVAAQLAAPAG